MKVMQRVRTAIRLEDGRSFEPVVFQDVDRHGLWFIELDGLAGARDHREVGPFGNEAEARGYLLSRIERELGRVSTVRRIEA